jgi:hypothetical protein
MIAVLVFALALPVFAAAPVRSEARVYFSNYDQLVDRLGEMLGELDVCTQGSTPDGRDYLLVDATADELKAIRACGLETEVTWPDIRDKFRAMTGCNPDDGSFRDFGYYFNYWEMRDTIRKLALSFPSLVTIDSSPRSFQNRRFYIVKVSDNPGINENEPQVFFNGATHAREPMGTHACVAYASLLCKNYATDSMTRWLVNNREIYLSPVQNPDGYIYNSDSGGTSANWRKNRNNTSPRTGPGVDLNRNYGYRWGLNNSGSSPTPSSETYRGPSRFSEPETQVIRDLQLAHKFRVSQDFHTYGQYNLLPYGFTTAWPAHGADSIAWRAIADTMEANNGYSTGPTMRVLYETNGSSHDWAFADTLWNGVPKFISFGVSSELGINDFWYGSSNPSYVDAELALNMPNCYYLTRVAGVYLVPAGSVVNDTASGNANGRLDPGETANLWFKLKNQAIHPLDTAKTVTAVLVSPDTMIQVITPSANLPAIPRMTGVDSRAGQIQVVCSPNATPNSNVDLRLEVTFTDDGVTIMQPLTYRITLGNQLGVAQTPDYTHAELSLAPAGNPTRGSIMLSAVIPDSRSGTSLRLFNETGKLVRTLLAGRPHAGRYSLSWDRKDDAGLLLPAGIYYARLVSGSTGVTSKLVITD